ncbi:MAG: ATP-binding protein, partial [Tissierellia bacterium]|nr:ATP-binding protein [Tissierellia bacterium]
MDNNFNCNDDNISKRFEAILEAIPSAVVVVNANDGKLVYINKRALELYGKNYVGYKIESHISMLNVIKFDGTPYPIEEMPALQALKYGRAIRNKAMIFERIDGYKIPVNVSATPIINAEGKVTEVVIIFEDMTERKAEEDMLNSMKSNLEQEVFALNKLHNIYTKINQQKDLKTMCSEILTAAIDLSHADMGNIQLLNDNELDIYVYFGFDESLLNYFKKSIKGINSWETALEEKFRVCVEDVSQSTLFAGSHDLNVLANVGVKSVQSTPLITSTGKLLGILSTHYKENHKFEDREIRMLDMLAHQAANLIERTQVFEILERSEKKSKALVNKLYQSIMLVNNILNNLELGFARFTYPNLKLITINNKGYDLLKKIKPNIGSKIKIKGSNLFEYFYNISNIREKYCDTIERNKSNFIELRKLYIDGEERYYKFIHQLMSDINKEIFEVVVLIIDVTKEEKSRNFLKDAIKTQDELYANVSHELKTPINVIFSANQMMDMYLNSDYFNKEKFCSYNKSIKQNCYRLIKLINNIVDLSKSNSGFLKPNLKNVNIVEIVENIVQSVSDYVKTKQLKILFDTDIEEKIMACDVAMVERILLNLISNAIKYSNAGSIIMINLFDKTENIEIDVIDTGAGIEKKHLDKLFKKYYQTDKTFSRNAEGSGIGLSLVKSIVEILGGTISVESEIGKGSTFKVLLPVKIIHEINEEYKSNYNNKIEMLNI